MSGLLTPEELETIGRLRDSWLTSAFSTERADRAACEAAVRACYAAADMTEPDIAWADSPQAGMQMTDDFPEAKFADVRQALIRGANSSGQYDFSPEWQTELRREFRINPTTVLFQRIVDMLDPEEDDKSVYHSMEPWYDGFNVAERRAVNAVKGVADSPLVAALDQAIGGLGWWWTGEGTAILTDRPTVLSLDNQTRLHSATGPAIAWADGIKFYAWHGVHVPADMIEYPGWDAARILREPNVEVRRCAIEHLGWDRFIVDAGLKQVGESIPDPGNPGQELALFDVPEDVFTDEAIRVLLVTNGTVERDNTRRRFGLTVPAAIDNPLAAAAWGYQDEDHPVRMTKRMYGQLARRC